MPICPSCGQDNPDIARFCLACATPLEVALAKEERKVVTVLFADLVGFTSRTEQMDPEDVQGLLAPYHRRLRSELERFGGTVEKFIGDAVMALFGAPVAHEDDPERAVRAALAIRDWVREEKDELQLRIAVNTGETLIALGARPGAGEGMASGDVVNTTARLQSAAPVNGILVGEATWRATRDRIEYVERDPVSAKGKSAPIPVWEALQARASVGMDLEQRSLTPLAGRERELEALFDAFGRVCREREPQLVTLVGVPGIGKSRLVAELFQRIDVSSELVWWRQGRALPYGAGVSFWALGEIVKAQAGIHENDADDEAAAKLRASVEHTVDDQEREWVLRHLEPVVGLGEDAAPADRNQAFAGWRRYLEGVAEQRPLVLVFEDLHWADDGLLDFVDYLADWATGVPLLVLGTARPEFLDRRPGWGGGKLNAATVALSALSDADAARVIAAVLEQALLPAEMQETLLERAGGNPLYAEQFARLFIERGSVEELPMPENVQGIIAARLDALSAAEKTVLQDAAVLGKVFWSGGLASLTAVEADTIPEVLHGLERKGFVRRERRSAVAGESEFAFRHVLVREVAYGQVPRPARAEKHVAAGEWMETLGRADDHAELLAHHYATALELTRAAGIEDDPSLLRRARESLRGAGERAMALSAYESAETFFADALAFCPSGDPDRPRLLLLRARALLPLGGTGLELATEAVDAFRAAEDVEGAAEAASIAARFSWFAGDRSATDSYMALALDALADRPASRAKAEALTHQSGFHMLAGRFDASIRVGGEALPMAEALGMDDQRARLHIVVGCARCCLGDTEGLDEIENGISVAQAAGAFEMVALGYGNLSSEHHFFGRLADARGAWSRSLELAQRYGFARLLRSARAERVGWAFLDGRWDEAIAIANELIVAIDENDVHYTDPAVLSVRASMLLAWGDAAGAAADSQRAAELARTSDAQAQSTAFCVRAAVALAAGKRDEAGELASELAAIGPVLLPALCSPFPNLAEVAWIFRDLGREDEFRLVLDATPIKSPWVDAARAIADGDLVRAADTIDGMGHPASAAYARLRAADSLFAEGREREADEQRGQAEVFFRKAGGGRKHPFQGRAESRSAPQA